MRRLVLVLVAAVTALTATHAVARAQYEQTVNVDVSPTLSNPAGAMKDAREHVAAGDITGAIKNLGVYVQSHPSEIEPARLLGDLFYRNGDLKSAEVTYLAILAYYPYDKETHNRLGTVYATENRVDAAISQFNQSLPGTDSVSDLIALHERKGDIDSYLGELQHNAASGPNNVGSQSELGQAFLALRRPSEALLAFRRALDSDGEDLTSLNGMGMALHDMKAFDAAIPWFQHCLKDDPGNYSCTNNMGASYLEHGAYDIAETTLKQAYALAPERAEALINFGYLADVRGDWKGAVAWYVRALGASPYARDAYFDLGLDYDQHRLFDQAEAVLLKGIALNPADGPMHAVLGQTYQDGGKIAMALDQFRLAAASLDPTIVGLARQRFAALDGGHTPPPN